MSRNKILTAILEILAIFIVMPIWFYLLHSILSAVQATELMWFLYWVYIPTALLMVFISKLYED